MGEVDFEWSLFCSKICERESIQDGNLNACSVANNPRGVLGTRVFPDTCKIHGSLTGQHQKINRLPFKRWQHPNCFFFMISRVKALSSSSIQILRFKVQEIGENDWLPLVKILNEARKVSTTLKRAGLLIVVVMERQRLWSRTVDE